MGLMMVSTCAGLGLLPSELFLAPPPTPSVRAQAPLHQLGSTNGSQEEGKSLGTSLSLPWGVSVVAASCPPGGSSAVIPASIR